MNLKGVQLQLLMGPSIAIPAPRAVAEALESVEVSHSDSGRSGFELVFKFEHSSLAGAAGELLLTSPIMQVFSRVVLSVILKGIPRVLMDGIITNSQLTPGTSSGSSSLTLIGEDISIMLDREEKNVEHPGQADSIIVYKIIASYAQYSIIPLIIPPSFFDVPLPTDRTPVQQSTDLAYIKSLAERYGYMFYITPGPAVMTNTAYWGPPIRVGVPQKALTVNMGFQSNVELLNFQHNALEPVKVSGYVQDRQTNQALPVMSFASLRPPLASMPDLVTNQAFIRTEKLRLSGASITQALARAQAKVDQASDQVLVANGEVDSLVYGDLLQPRALVGLRGAGLLHDGYYYVKEVKHHISRGSYRQSFTLAREGLGTTVPAVLP